MSSCTKTKGSFQTLVLSLRFLHHYRCVRIYLAKKACLKTLLRTLLLARIIKAHSKCGDLPQRQEEGSYRMNGWKSRRTIKDDSGIFHQNHAAQTCPFLFRRPAGRGKCHRWTGAQMVLWCPYHIQRGYIWYSDADARMLLTHQDAS